VTQELRDLASNDLWRESMRRSRERRKPGSRARTQALRPPKTRIPEAQAMGLVPAWEPRDLTSRDLWTKSILRSQHRRRALEQARANRKPVRRAGSVAVAAAAVLPAATGVATADNSGSTQPAVAGAQQSLLKTGSHGPPVARVQGALGISADGVYGPDTTASVRSFQEGNGLTVDGIVGPQTWSALGLGTWSGSTTLASSATAPASTASSHSGRASVSDVQRVVGVPVDGVFGPQTDAAVKRWQRAHGLTVDGIVGPATAQAMGIGSISTPLREVHRHHAHAHRSSGSDSGDSTSVSDVQRALGIPADGVFGPQTAEAVKKWQKAHGLTADGIVGPATADAMGLSAPSHPLKQRGSDSSGGGSDSSGSSSVVSRMISAANAIANKPYVYGGGHGSFVSSGYDCSGSVSYVLHAGGLLSSPLDSTSLESYGAPGPGSHVTIYANSGHAWMTIDGRRFDTGGGGGSRWKSSARSGAGFVVRHPVGY
jgi:peptidoglycan hydrolase-like protein with peptidoglycan-binding domain